MIELRLFLIFSHSAFCLLSTLDHFFFLHSSFDNLSDRFYVFQLFFFINIPLICMDLCQNMDKSMMQNGFFGRKNSPLRFNLVNFLQFKKIRLLFLSKRETFHAISIAAGRTKAPPWTPLEFERLRNTARLLRRSRQSIHGHLGSHLTQPPSNAVPW